MAVSAKALRALGNSLGDRSAANEIVASVDSGDSGGSGSVGSATAITTVGAGVLTAASIVGRYIIRSGPTAAYSDTTATAALIIAAMGTPDVGDSFELKIKNTVAFTETLVAGSGVTLAGLTTVPPNSVGVFLVKTTSGSALTITGIGTQDIDEPPVLANTADTTVGAATLSAAAIVGGYITRTGSTAAYTDTSATAALIVAALPNAAIGQSWIVKIKNNTAFPETVAGGSGVTVSGVSIIPPFAVGEFVTTYTAAATVTMVGIGASPMNRLPLGENTAITTVGAGVLSAAGIAGRVITRSGSTAAYSDATDTAVAILAAYPSVNVGDAWEFSVKNTVAFAETVTAGAGVTLAGLVIVPPLSVNRFLVKVTAATTVTITGIDSVPICNLPVAKYATAALATGTLTAGQITGAQHVYLETTTDGAASMTTRTATEMFNDTPNAQVGGTYLLTLINSGDNTLTLLAGVGTTLTGTMTVATATTRTFVVSFTSATALVIQGVNKGTLEAT